MIAVIDGVKVIKDETFPPGVGLFIDCCPVRVIDCSFSGELKEFVSAYALPERP